MGEYRRFLHEGGAVPEGGPVFCARERRGQPGRRCEGLVGSPAVGSEDAARDYSAARAAWLGERAEWFRALAH
jgi:hypothetical protein